MPVDVPSIQCASTGRRAVFPLWLKLAAALFLAVFVPVYWIYYGPMNILWFSNIGPIGIGSELGTATYFEFRMTSLRSPAVHGWDTGRPNSMSLLQEAFVCGVHAMR